MYAAYTKVQDAQKVKQFLVKNKILHQDYLPVKVFDFIYFPMTKKMEVPKAKTVIPKLSFPSRKKIITAEELLKKKLTERQLKLLPQTQEIVGDILILEIPTDLQKKEKLIAEAYLAQHKNINTVVKKVKTHSGTFRTRGVKIIAGKRRKETLHQENGVKMKVHLENMYFSARSGNERLRIAKQVKKNENILVMFSGAAPYPLVIAKHSPAAMVYGIEMNPLAHLAALSNVSLNKLDSKIKIFEGDVLHILPKIKKKFNRIIMPLPKTGEDFLGLALRKAKSGTVIHLYAFLQENDIDKEAKKIKELSNNSVRVLRKVKCGQFSPGTFRVCFDLKVK